MKNIYKKVFRTKYRKKNKVFHLLIMVTSKHGIAFCITGPGTFPLQRASGAEL